MKQYCEMGFSLYINKIKVMYNFVDLQYTNFQILASVLELKELAILVMSHWVTILYRADLMDG